MGKKISGIYCIENRINNKKYIGRAINVERRWAVHKSSLKRGCHENTHLQRAWDKYGEDNFIFYLISCFPIEELDNREVYYIKEFRSHVTEWGYNISWGGKTPMLGRKMPEEQKRKISLAELGKHRGSPSQETRDKISLRNKGKIISDERKKVLSDSWKGEKNPNFGKPFPEDRKRKMIETKRKNQKNKPKKEKQDPQNRKIELGFSSRYLGVTYKKDKRKWKAYIKINGKQKHIGYFDNELDAVFAYNNYVLDNNINKKINIIEGVTDIDESQNE